MAGNSQSGRRKQKAAATKEAAAPQGAVGSKRTPTSAFDPAAGAQVYEPEMICAQRVAKGMTQYEVKWVGYSERSNTWEPIEHLAGCEDMIVEFKKREKIRLQKLDERGGRGQAGAEGSCESSGAEGGSGSGGAATPGILHGGAPNVAAEAVLPPYMQGAFLNSSQRPNVIREFVRPWHDAPLPLAFFTR
ncbi:hypothetical protein AB1Y20_020149 [Prymnesium parvum]|uniref:Chromo domain-containing protein n=1 Tax=Prymnesium parvum TaxID=97485 RepID=A0AB34JWR9_PRYPA